MKEGRYNFGFEVTKGDSILDVQESTNGSSLTSSNGFYWSADPITYSWNNVNVYTKREKSLFSRQKEATVKTKHILKDVSGICRPGELLAIMGASGAGKTTLLNVLTGRSGSNLAVRGDLFVNGQRTDPADLTRRSAYVQQEDLFIGTLTVREQLVFQATLRMDSNIPSKQRMQRVNQVLIELGLKKCEDTLIGIPGRLKGISGGETKRLAFACEVLTNPALMFCDEPTSGLDSFMAENIVACMRSLAMQGKTIISTIHQPSSEVFAMFDQVLLMAEGRVAFLGLTSDALDFYRSLGHACPRNFNPADFFISTLAISPDDEKRSREFVHKACEAFSKSSHGISIQNAIMDNQKSTSVLTPVGKTKVSPYKASWFPMFGAVLKRAWLEVVREPMLFKIKLFQTIMLALLLGIIYWGQNLNQSGIVNINGALFLLITNVTFNNTFGVVNTFCAQIPIFMREHKNGMYRVDTYFLAKNVAELPIGILFPCIFAAVIYYMIGLNEKPEHLFMCMAVLLLVANCAVSFGYFVSCVSVSINMALVISAPLIIPLMLFGGFFLNSETVPVYFIWLQYISWFNYGNEALMLNQWQDIHEIDCEYTEETFCMKSGHDVLKRLGYSDGILWVDFAALGAILIGFRFLAFCALLAKSYRK